MSVKIKGMNKIIKQIEERLDPKRLQAITDLALQDGAAVFVAQLKNNFQRFKDTGESIKEITISDPFTDSGGVRQISVHWKGPNDRYRIIHLNEWGTIKNPNPAGKGAIASALKSSEKAYAAALKKRLEQAL